MLAPNAERRTPIYITDDGVDPGEQLYRVKVRFSANMRGKHMLTAVYPLEYKSFQNGLYMDSNETLQRRAIQEIAECYSELAGFIDGLEKLRR
jgi:hypothetical protein